MVSTTLRDEAMKILNGGGAILKVAREVTRIIRNSDLECAVIGGVAVVLHGHVRTTTDVDVYVADSLEAIAEALRDRKYIFNSKRREFVKYGVPVHLVTVEQLRQPPKKYQTIDGIQTVTLAELIGMKLRSGMDDPLRAQDLADVVGLIRSRRLKTDFAAQLPQPLRATFRKLAKAIWSEK